MHKYVGTVECVDQNAFVYIMNIRINRGERIVSAGRTDSGAWWELLEWEEDNEN